MSNNSEQGPDIDENDSTYDENYIDNIQEDKNNEDGADNAQHEIVTKPRMRCEISSGGLDGLHWNNNSNTIGAAINDKEKNDVKCECTTSKILSKLFELESSKATPPYGFNKGLKLLKEEGYEAIIKDLRDNLIGCDYANILERKNVLKEIRLKALSYLMFLKRKRTDTVKERGCADGRP